MIGQLLPRKTLAHVLMPIGVTEAITETWAKSCGSGDRYRLFTAYRSAAAQLHFFASHIGIHGLRGQ
jgi:hypothetical protein